MLPDHLQIIKMFEDIITLLCCALEKSSYPSDDGGVAIYFMYHLKIPLDLISQVILAHVNFLHSQDVLIDKHGHIVVIKVPVSGSNRVVYGVRPPNIAKNIFSNII